MSSLFRFPLIAALVAFPLLWGCAESEAPPAKERPPVERLSLADYPQFSDDLNLEGLAAAVQSSLTYLERIPPDRTFTFGPDAYPAAHIARSLRTFLDFLEESPDGDALNRFIRERYRLYRSIGGPETGRMLFTGYYEPLLQGSRTESEDYPHPVHGRPADLSVVDLGAFSSELDGKKITGRVSGKTFVPYPDRRAIVHENAVAEVAETLIWARDRVDLFFLQVQGSGKVALSEGGETRLRYAAQNGRPYVSIGKLLIEEGAIPREEMSMQRLKSWLRDNPGEVDRVLTANPSYVFFAEADGGPYGALNVALTPGRSLAVDRRIMPMATLSFIRTEKPVPASDDPDHPGAIREWKPFSRFVLNQDTGGAIRGPGRADLFWGAGAYAELAAGHLQHPGELFVLVLDPAKAQPPSISFHQSNDTE
jgi:membrane-bound lytic murein transglycosylase A